MNDDVLRAVWLSNRAADETTKASASAVDAVLREEHLADRRERRIRMLLVTMLIALCPVLLWASAHGRTPLIRGAYGLMALGVGVAVFAEWLWLGWSRAGMPGPADMQSQLRAVVVVLGRQADLLSVAWLWSAPIFVGAGMVAYWIAQARSMTGGAALGTGIGLAWVVAAAATGARARAIERRRSRMAQILADLSAPAT